MKLATTIMFLTLACGAAPEPSRDFEQDDPVETPEVEQPEPTSCSEACPTPAVEEMATMLATPPPTMYVNPFDPDQELNDDLLFLALRAIERIHLRTGAVIEVSDNPLAIPLRINDNDTAGGRAVTDKWCFGGNCTSEHAHISLRSDTLARIYVDNFADNSLAHEFAHVLSGWGHCSDIDVKGHLDLGHIISNGNEGYGKMSWTDEDTDLTCSCGACP